MIKAICDFYDRSDDQVKTAFKWAIVLSPVVFFLFLFPGQPILLRFIVGLLFAYRMKRLLKSFRRSRELSDERYWKRIQSQREDWSEPL